jgi:hypothetical protein
MSDIGLLMAGVLTAGQAFPPKLPEQPPLPSDNVVQQSKQSEAKKIVPPTQITPPELIQPDASPKNVQSALKPEHQNILNKIREKIPFQSSFAQVGDKGDEGDKEDKGDKGDKGEFAPPIPPIPPSPPPPLSPSPPPPLPPSPEMSQVTSVSQLDDVQPQDWAIGALQSLVERYGCIAGYPNRTYLGNTAINRYEFAAGLQHCLEQINKLITNNTANTVKDEDLIALQRLQTEFQAELKQVLSRIDNLESQTSVGQANQFSTTTRLFGQAIFSLQGTNSADVDLFPRDKVPERKAETNLTFANSVQLTLATSFTGQDLLITGLSSGNLNSSASSVFNNMGRLGFESNTNNDLYISDLSYRFPVSDNLGIIVGTVGVNPTNTFRGINPLEGTGEGAISLLGQRNPILAIGNGTGGVGFDWQISSRLSLQGIYSAEIPSFPGDIQAGGLFGGRYTAGAQLTVAPTNNIDVGLHYLFSHSPDGLLGTGIGDAQLISPFAPATAFNTHAVGATVTWRINPNFNLGGWGGWTHSNPVNLSGSVETTNWMVFAAFPNLLRSGNLGGILVGQPPKITSSSLPEGFNFPNFSEGGTAGGRDDTSLHVELFYRAQLNDNISLTPGVFVIFNPDHNAANDLLLIGALRATFRF